MKNAFAYSHPRYNFQLLKGLRHDFSIIQCMSRPKVYIATTDTTLANGLKSALTSAAFEVALFERGYDVAAMMDNWPDVFLIDIQLPDINGFEICTWLKSHDDSSHIPVILMTGEWYLNLLAASSAADNFIETGNAVSQIVEKVNDCLSGVRVEHKA